MPPSLRPGAFEPYATPRGTRAPDHPAGFWWVGLDGSRVRVEWLPHSYAVGGTVPDSFVTFPQIVDHMAKIAEAYAYNCQFAALSGFDLSAPSPRLPDFIRRYNALGSDIELVLATAEEYFQAQAAAQLVELRGDLN